MTRYIKPIIWGSVLLIIIATLSFVAIRKSKEVCKSIVVNILDSAKNQFVDRNNVLELLYKKKQKIVGYSIDSINVGDIERILNNHPSIKTAQAYKSFDGILKVDILQRFPVVRIINTNGNSYYIDDEAKIMPLSANYTSRILVASGEITEGYSLKNRFNILKVDTLKYKKNILKDIYELAFYINSDEFLKAQIEQIYVTNEQEFELIPLVGEHIIVLGKIDDYQAKLKKLMAFYQNGLNQLGWNKYSAINLKYKNQVVCTRKD